MNYDYDDHISAQYEQYQRDEQRRLLATVTTPEDDEEARFYCQEMSDQAEADENYTNRCIAGEKVFYFSYPKGLIPGHIYSLAGKAEFGISRSCEYHFDEWTKEPEDNDGLD